jgi:hypothetical protein
LAADYCRRCNGSASHARPGCCCAGSHVGRRTAPWRSMARRLAPGAASSVSRRECGAPRRNLAHLGCAAAAPGAGQARDGAPVRRRQACRVSGIASGRPPGRSRWLRQVSTAVVRRAFHSGRSPTRRAVHLYRSDGGLGADHPLLDVVATPSNSAESTRRAAAGSVGRTVSSSDALQPTGRDQRPPTCSSR